MKRLALIASLIAACGLVGCGEIDQKAKVEKVYAGKKDTRAAEDSRFGGDKKKWEAALTERSKGQNEYLRTGAAKS
jgi:predicted small lipoprotein YifL